MHALNSYFNNDLNYSNLRSQCYCILDLFNITSFYIKSLEQQKLERQTGIRRIITLDGWPSQIRTGGACGRCWSKQESLDFASPTQLLLHVIELSMELALGSLQMPVHLRWTKLASITQQKVGRSSAELGPVPHALRIM